MTPTQYAIVRLAKMIGLHNRSKRLSDAGGELLLLREAELYLGHAVWENAGHIPSVSTEYWQLRQLSERQLQIQKLLAEKKAIIEENERLQTAEPVSSPMWIKLQKYRKRMQEAVRNLAMERDQLNEDAKRARRIFEGMKAKHDVLSKDPIGNAAEIHNTLVQIQDGLKDFAELKNRRIQIAEKIQLLDAQLLKVETAITKEKRKHDITTLHSVQSIGAINREISTLRGELGNISLKMQSLQGDIGRIISRYADRSTQEYQAIWNLTKSHRALTVVMGALRQSIAYNHMLAED